VPDLLLAVDDAIWLDHAAAEIDTAMVSALIPQATGAGRLDLLTDTLRQYRGPFLDGFALPDSVEFDAWASQERQVWERRYLDALAVLVEGYAAAGAYHAAIETAQRALATDELAEDMHRRLIALWPATAPQPSASSSVVSSCWSASWASTRCPRLERSTKQRVMENKETRRLGDKETRRAKVGDSPGLLVAQSPDLLASRSRRASSRPYLVH
jgi:hypothetical protein